MCYCEISRRCSDLVGASTRLPPLLVLLPPRLRTGLMPSVAAWRLSEGVLLMTAGGPSVGTPCSGWGQAIGIVTCLSGVIVLALTVTVVETKLALSGKANVALQWDEFDICKVRERHAAAKYIQKLWKLNHELVDKPALRASRKFLRRRAIARSVVSVGLAEARRRRVLAQRELGWLPMDDMAEQWALSEEDRIAAAEAEQNAAAEQPRAAVGLGADGGATGAVVPPELITTLNQILAAQAELARVQESLVQVRTGLRLPVSARPTVYSGLRCSAVACPALFISQGASFADLLGSWRACVLLLLRPCDILARRQPHSSARSSVARLRPEA